MLTNPETSATPSKSILKNPLLYSSVALGIAILVVGWILFSRWEANRQIERRPREEPAGKRGQSARARREQPGGKELAIQSSSASLGLIHRGESVQLCYG